MRGPIEQLSRTSETTAEPSVASESTRVWTTPAMQVRIQIVKNLEYLTCLEIRKTNHEQ